MTNRINYEDAMRDPAACFAAPGDVLAAPGLTTDQKVAILREWAYDESEIAVAQEEGMPGGDTQCLQTIAAALAELDPHADGETAPNKQRMPPSP